LHWDLKGLSKTARALASKKIQVRGLSMENISYKTPCSQIDASSRLVMRSIAFFTSAISPSWVGV
jgi:hypothetical protein